LLLRFLDDVTLRIIFDDFNRMALPSMKPFQKGSLGWDQYGFVTQPNLIKAMVGVWQILAPRYWEPESNATLTAGNADAKAAHDWWNSLWVPNSAPAFQGYPRDFNSRAIMPWAVPPQVPSNCNNNSQLEIAKIIPRFPFVSNNMTLGAQGDLCTGSGKYLLGYMYLFSAMAGFSIPTLTEHMWHTLSCGRMLIGLFDSYTKSGKTTTEDINARRLLSSVAQGNITKLLNDAQIPDWSGSTFLFDSGADLISDQSYRVYQPISLVANKTTVFGVPVGNWNAKKDEINWIASQEKFIFLGNRTAPPPPRVIPTVSYEAKMAVRWAFNAIVGLCSAFTLALFVYMLMNIKVKIFVASSPRFLALIVLGANISFIGVWLFSMFPMVTSTSNLT
jgi:hypothetical protein